LRLSWRARKWEKFLPQPCLTVLRKKTKNNDTIPLASLWQGGFFWTQGKETDKNKDKRIRNIIDTFTEIGDSTFNYGIFDNYYFYAQKSKVKKKEKIKVKVMYEEIKYGRVR
jgi:hypothetical protein